MVVYRQPLLKPEIEEELKLALSPLWYRGDSAEMIAKELGFGEPKTPWEKLKEYHVWFYRSKFGLPPRRDRSAYKGRSRYKDKKEEIMPPDLFFKRLDKLDSNTFHHRRQRAYVILHYWTPLRKSEIYERKIEDFKISETQLTITLFRKKKVSKVPEPIDIPLAFPKMDEVVDYLQNGQWKKYTPPYPFKISSTTAWQYVREAFPGYYPHFFRFNYITDGFMDTETSIVEMRAKTGLDISTLNNYIMKARGFQESLDKRKLERLKEQGMLK